MGWGGVAWQPLDLQGAQAVIPWPPRSAGLPSEVHCTTATRLLADGFAGQKALLGMAGAAQGGHALPLRRQGLAATAAPGQRHASPANLPPAFGAPQGGRRVGAKHRRPQPAGRGGAVCARRRAVCSRDPRRQRGRAGHHQRHLLLPVSSREWSVTVSAGEWSVRDRPAENLLAQSLAGWAAPNCARRAERAAWYTAGRRDRPPPCAILKT